MTPLLPIAEPTELAAGLSTDLSDKTLWAGSLHFSTTSSALPLVKADNFCHRWTRFLSRISIKLTQVLLLFLMLSCVSGCQIGGGLNRGQQIALTPSPTLKPVIASKVAIADNRQNAAPTIAPAFTQSHPSVFAAKSNAHQDAFHTPRSSRTEKNRLTSTQTLTENGNATSGVSNSIAKKSSSSMQVAFQENAINPLDAARIPSDLPLPFERSEADSPDDTVADAADADEDETTALDADGNDENDNVENEDGRSYQRDQSNAASSTSAALTYNSNSLALEQVIASVQQCYPEIEIAIGDIEEARGKILSSWGEFDTVQDAYSISKPLSFYEQYRNGTGLTRPLYGGGEVTGGYRSGRGTFEPWYGERETDEAGEFKVSISIPLLKDRDIDKRRTALIAAGFARDQVEANVETRLLKFERFASQAYWDWVASGQAVVIQQQLLKLAEKRVEQISLRIEQGDLAKISEIDNDRFIAKRKNTLIKARRGLEKAAIKMSLFYRDVDCSPVVVNEQRLPLRFPQSDRIVDQLIQSDIGTALQNRPELVELAAARREACIKLQYANNLLLPKLDIKSFAAKDIGNLTSSAGDKRPFELEIGVFAELPLQRREGAGKIQSAQGKITQIDAKRRLVSDKIRAEIQDAASAVNNAFDQIRQSRVNVRLNEQSLELGRLAFEEGDIDLLALNIYESSVADARLELLEAEHKYFYSLAIYKTITRSEAFLAQ